MKHLKLIIAFLISLGGTQTFAQEKAHLPQMSYEEVKQFSIENPSKLVIVLLSAKWCMACHRIEPYYVKAAEALKDQSVSIVKVDYDQNKTWVETLKISSIPQTEFFYQGVHRWKYGAGLSDAQIVKESKLALEAAQKGTFVIESYSVLQTVSN